jgi:hypothetical protein
LETGNINAQKQDWLETHTDRAAEVANLVAVANSPHLSTQ